MAAESAYVSGLERGFKDRHARDVADESWRSQFLWLMVCSPGEDDLYKQKDPKPMLPKLRVLWGRVETYESELLSDLINVKSDVWMAKDNGRPEDKGFVNRALDCVSFFYSGQLDADSINVLRTTFFSKPVLDKLGRGLKSEKCARQVAKILIAAKTGTLAPLVESAYDEAKLSEDMEKKLNLGEGVKTRSKTRQEAPAPLSKKTRPEKQEPPSVVEEEPSRVLFLLLAASC